MALIPAGKGQTFQQPKSSGRLQPVVPKRQPQPRPDVRQSQNYINAQNQAQQYQQQAKQAGSFRGMAGNTLKGVGSTALGMGKEVLRMPLTVPLKVTQTLTEAITKKPQVYTPQTGVEKFFYGDQPRQSYTQDQAGITKWGQEKGMGKLSSNLLGAGGAGAEILMDLLPAGYGGKAISKLKAAKPFRKATSELGQLEAPLIGKSKTILPDVQKQLPTEMKLSSSYEPTLAQKVSKVKKETPLIQEARKYKSADEFVKNQPVFYHGSPTPLKSFSNKKGGVFFTDSMEDASGFAGSPDNVYEGYVHFKKPLVIDAKGAKWDELNTKFGTSTQEIISKAQKDGYDGITFKNIVDNAGDTAGVGGESTIHYAYKPKDAFLNEDQLKELWTKPKSQPLQEGGKITTEVLSKRADEIINPLKPKAKDRKFIETIRKSEDLSTDLKGRVDETYNVRRNKSAQEKAQRLIFENPLEAERLAKTGANDDAVFTANELVKNYDDIAKKAKESGNMADFNVAMDKAVEIAQENAKNLTEAGRAVQAASTINKLSPDGVIAYVNKAVKDVGGDFRLSNEKYYDIIRKAEDIKGILDPRTKALKTFDLIDDIYADIPMSLQNKVSEALNLPRAIMATADLSAPLRQGVFTMARNPKMFAKNFGKMFKYAFSEDAYRGLKADIITSPNYNLYVKHKLPLTDISQQLTGREEQFLSSWAEEIPGFGKLAKGSNRAYSGFLNKMRMDLFDDFVKTAKQEGITDPKFFDDASKFVGSATGRGRLWESVEPHAGLLNGVFFSPRLMASRANLLNPVYYAKLSPPVRKEALKTLASFVGTGMTVLGLAKINGADVSLDPRSADFGKIKIGKTRYDIWGGFQQYARFLGQLITGEKISTTTGKQTQLGSGGYNAPTRGSITRDFFESKFNPIASLINRGLKGKQFGEEFNVPAELLDRFIPMIASDAFDLMKEYGTFPGLAMTVPGAFGVGSQTYGDQIPKFTETASGNVGLEYRSEPGLGETIINKITGNEVSDVPEELWQPLAEERLAEQKRQVEVDKGKQMTLITGEPRTVGDTYIYLENGVVKTKKTSKEKRLPKKDELIKQAIEKRKTNPFYQ